MVSKKILLIINPTSGWGLGGKWEKWFKKKSSDYPGIKLDVVFSSKSGYKSIENQSRRAEGRGYSRVIVVAGDGGIHEAANGLAMSNIPLAIISTGTANDFARGLDIPRDIRKAFKVAMSGEEILIDLGRVVGRADDGRFFINVLSFGFDAKAVQSIFELKRRFKIVPNKVLYLFVLFKLLSLRIDFSEISINNGKLEKIIGLIITNGAKYGSLFKVAPNASYQDGELNICCIGMMSKLRLLETFFRLLNGTHGSLPGVVMNTASSLVISSPEDLCAEVDGERLEGKKCYVVTTHPKALRVIVPTKNK